MAGKRISWSANSGPGKKAGWERKSRSQEGLAQEKEVVKGLGGRPHPRSGAGSIKWDGSDSDAVYEVKDVTEAHMLKGTYLAKLFSDAVRQGKEAVYVVRFKKSRIRIECRITRDG